MADPQATLASASAAALGVVATSQLPDHFVVMGALLGALVSVWISRQRDPEPWSYKTLAGIAGHLGVSAMSGIVLSIMIVAMAPHYSVAKPLMSLPQWTIAATIAAVIHVLAPLVYRWLSIRSSKEVKGEVK